MSVNKTALILILAGLGFLFFFFIFTFIVKSDVLRQLDFNMTVKVQDKLPDKAYSFLHIVSELARFEVITVVLFLLIAVSRRWMLLIITLVIYGGSHVVELIGKTLLNQPPPPFMFYKLQSDIWFPSTYVSEGNSYPSGHSMRSIFLAIIVTALLLSSRKPSGVKLGVILMLFGFAALVALAKVALGQHWFTDVIAGDLAGIGGALLCAGYIFATSQSSHHT